MGSGIQSRLGFVFMYICQASDLPASCGSDASHSTTFCRLVSGILARWSRRLKRSWASTSALIPQDAATRRWKGRRSSGDKEGDDEEKDEEEAEDDDDDDDDDDDNADDAEVMLPCEVVAR